MDKSECLILMYEEKRYDKLFDIYESIKNKITLQNIFWLVVKGKNKRFVNEMFQGNKDKFDMKQLGLIKNNKMISQKSIFDQALRRLK